MKCFHKILYVVWLFALAACSKSRDQPVYINEHFRDTFDYKIGTYWIFYDSISSAMDTFTFLGSTHYVPYDYPNRVSSNVEIIQSSIYDSGNGPRLLWTMEVAGPYGLSISSPDGMFSHALMYGWPFQTKIATLIPEYTDMGITYQNVYYSKSFYHGSYDYTFDCWFHPEIGFITIKYTSSIIGSKSLHLVSHSIIR